MRLRGKVIHMEFVLNKNKEIDIYKDCGTVALLRCSFKAQHKGMWLYVPPELVNVLGLSKQDSHVFALILNDLDDKYSFIAITKENFITDKLRSLILDLKYKSTSRLEAAKKIAESSTATSTENAANLSLQEHDAYEV